ncbi:MAG TPA: DUF4288 domain-containing protein [Tepidisphaeraceae bacterium]|nr:DUF4288 domain-containing protein [Tepidisphaeraceae bacterium]
MKSRFAAKLLFQFRIQGSHSKRLTCEERTVLLNARSAKEALAKAKQKGRAAQTTPKRSDSNFYIEFVGVLDLLHLGIECPEDEVWYEIKEIISPMKRRAKLIRLDRELLFRGRMSDAEWRKYEKE